MFQSKWKWSNSQTRYQRSVFNTELPVIDIEVKIYLNRFPRMKITELHD